MRALTFLFSLLIFISCNRENMSTPMMPDDCNMTGTWTTIGSYIAPDSTEYNSFDTNLKTDFHLDNIQSIINNPNPETKILDLAPIWEFRSDGLWIWSTIKVNSYEINDECNEMITMHEENGSIQTMKSDFLFLREDIIEDLTGWTGGNIMIRSPN